MKNHIIKIGQKFTPYHSTKKENYTVTDIYTTTNVKNEIVRVVFICETLFIGQKIKKEFSKTTIIRSCKELQNQN